MSPDPAFDLAGLRADTPGCERVVHLNNAGAALPPRVVLDTQIDHLRREAEIGGYEAQDEAAGRLQAVYDGLARLINCAPDELALTENATVAWQQAFHALALRPGDRVLTAEAEYASNFIEYLRAAERRGISVEVVPSDASGALDVAALEAMLDERVKLISVTHVPTNGGLVNPAEAIGRVARRHGITYLLDACQSVGQLAVDVEAIGCDLLSATGRKYLRGPRGTGFLYVRRSILGRLDPRFVDLHGARWVAPDRYELRPDARRFENWESNIAAQLGFGAAVDYVLALGTRRIEARVIALADGLRRRLAEIPGVTLRDIGEKRCGICTFTMENRDPEELQQYLHAAGINVTTTSRDGTLLDMQRRGLTKMVRASVHYYNSETELDHVCAVLRQIK